MKVLKNISWLFTLIIVIINAGCKKLIEVDPPINQIVASEVYKNNASANSVVTGLYNDMGANSFYIGTESIEILTSLMSDEMFSISDGTSIYTPFFTNSTLHDAGIWANSYNYIFRVNSAIEGCSTSPGITPGVKKQLLGELKFLRAYTYFYLVNLYGDVPLVLTTDVKVNSNISRSSAELVYNQMVRDLSEAKDELNTNYVGGDAISTTTLRVRPNASAASALLSRIYLYTKKWDLAEQEASKVITQVGIYTLDELPKVFLNTSKEAIWQVQPTLSFLSTTIPNLLNLKAIGDVPSGPSVESRPLFLSSELYEQFDSKDLRKVNWTDTSVVIDGNTSDTLGKYPFAYKYKTRDISESGNVRTEYYMVLRLAEQILIRAEARAMLGQVSGANSAEEDINRIKQRAGLPAISLQSQSQAVTAILNERKFELFDEGCHRWFDLKRTNTINVVMNAVAPRKSPNGQWAPYKALLPIPSGEFKNNPNLRGHQNPGYSEN